MNGVNWERIWRGSGIAFVIFFIISYVIYGNQPRVGASVDRLVSFYDGDRVRILIAAFVFGFALLNLLWFAAALANTLRDAGQGVWGAAATVASAALAAVFFVLITLNAALAYSIAGSGNITVTSALNDLAWALEVIASFALAMLIMSGSFGLRQAGIISNGLFAAGVLAIILVLLGATTWATDGFWAPDGAYSRFVSPIIALVWITVFSGLLYLRGPSTGVRTRERATTPAA
jgi:hypothetical protein